MGLLEQLLGRSMRWTAGMHQCGAQEHAGLIIQMPGWACSGVDAET